MANKHIYTVSELTRNIRALLEDTFGMIWIEGEISNLTNHTSGHTYFSLKDEWSVLACVLFKRVGQSQKFEIKAGMHVICFGKISVYDKKGQHQLIVEKIEPKGVGALQLAFEQLKEKLRKEGLFDAAHKKAIPYLPTRIGIVTSPTGAAIRDILNVAKRRFSNVEIILNPVKVQGDGAASEIAAAIRIFNALRCVDVMIVGRGGGSLEDLWPFNEEIVARAIYGSNIPVISAVGHEIDWTIADFTADFRAPTPSAAAELVIPEKEKLGQEIRSHVTRLGNALLNMSGQCGQEIDDLLKDIISGAEYTIKAKGQLLAALAGKLEALSPLAVLGRGYSITFAAESGKVIKDANTLKKNDKIRTKLAAGEVISRVEEGS